MKLTIKVTTPSEERYTDNELASMTIAVPELDETTLGQLAAKIAQRAAALVDDAVQVSGRAKFVTGLLEPLKAMLDETADQRELDPDPALEPIEA